MDNEFNSEFIELAFWYQPISSISAIDALIGVLIGDGDKNKLARNAVIDG